MTKPAPIAEEPKPTSDSATAASGGSAAETSGPQAQEQQSDAGVSVTMHEAAQGNAETIKVMMADGVLLSEKPTTETAPIDRTKNGSDDGKIVDFPGDRKTPTTVDEVRAQREADAQARRGAGADEPQREEIDTLEPTERVDVQAFNDFARDITQVGNWGAMKPILADFRRSEAFLTADSDLRGQALKLAWDLAMLWPMPEGDVDFYRLWVATAAQKHEVRPAFRKLMRAAEYQNLDPETRDLVVDETNHAAGDA